MPHAFTDVPHDVHQLCRQFLAAQGRRRLRSACLAAYRMPALASATLVVRLEPLEDGGEGAHSTTVGTGRLPWWGGAVETVVLCRQCDPFDGPALASARTAVALVARRLAPRARRVCVVVCDIMSYEEPEAEGLRALVSEEEETGWTGLEMVSVSHERVGVADGAFGFITGGYYMHTLPQTCTLLAASRQAFAVARCRWKGPGDTASLGVNANLRELILDIQRSIDYTIGYAQRLGQDLLQAFPGLARLAVTHGGIGAGCLITNALCLPPTSPLVVANSDEGRHMCRPTASGVAAMERLCPGTFAVRAIAIQVVPQAPVAWPATMALEIVEPCGAKDAVRLGRTFPCARRLVWSWTGGDPADADELAAAFSNVSVLDGVAAGDGGAGSALIRAVLADPKKLPRLQCVSFNCGQTRWLWSATIGHRRDVLEIRGAGRDCPGTGSPRNARMVDPAAWEAPPNQGCAALAACGSLLYVNGPFADRERLRATVLAAIAPHDASDVKLVRVNTHAGVGALDDLLDDLRAVLPMALVAEYRRAAPPCA